MIQQQMTALIGKFPKIDAVINDSDGFAALGVVRAYQAADKPLVPLGSLEANGLACEYLKLKDRKSELPDRHDFGPQLDRTHCGTQGDRRGAGHSQQRADAVRSRDFRRIRWAVVHRSAIKPPGLIRSTPTSSRRKNSPSTASPNKTFKFLCCRCLAARSSV